MIKEILAAATLSLSTCDHPTVSDSYIRAAESAVYQYWPIARRPYKCWLVAVLIAESNADPTAVSPAGAQGIAQFLPPTWREEAGRIGVTASPFDAYAAIDVSASFMNRLAHQFDGRPRTQGCGLGLASAAYNSGLGNVLKAQVLADGALCWDDGISEKMPEVTGRHAKETQSYVARIRKWFHNLTGVYV